MKYIGVLGAMLFGLAGVASALAETLSGRVVDVTDGDVIVVLVRNQETTVRLADIDAPEHGQDFNQASTRALFDLAYGQFVMFDVIGKDRYGRTVARVRNENGDDVSAEQVRRGMAWAYRKYTRNQPVIDAEASARDAGAGLWQQPGQLPPWEFRRKTRGEDAQDEGLPYGEPVVKPVAPKPVPAAAPVSAPAPRPPQARSRGVPAQEEQAEVDLRKFFRDTPSLEQSAAARAREPAHSAGGGSGYGSGRQGEGGGPIHTGPRGGRYTISPDGNRDYLPRH